MNTKAIWSRRRQGKHALHLLGVVAFLTAVGAARLKTLGPPNPDRTTPTSSNWSRSPKSSPYEIVLKRRRFAPAQGLAVAKSRQGRKWHGMIQFFNPPSTTVLNKLRAAGVKIQHFVDEYVVAGAIPPTFNPATIPEIRWIGPLTASDKISNYFRNAALVQFFPDTTAAEVNAALSAVGATAIARPSLPAYVVYANLTAAQANSLAANDAVAWIGAAPTSIVQGRMSHYCPGIETKAGRIAPYSTRALAFSSGWDGPGQGSANLLFHYVNSTPDLTVSVQRAELARALRKWSEVAAITFSETSTAGQENSIDLTFTLIDGPSNTLGVTPASFRTDNQQLVDADIDFDEGETWRSGSDIDLFTVALHEAGHALGLDHSDDPTAVMFPTYEGVVSGLAQDDINGIRSIYAAVTPTPTPAPTATPTPTTPPAPTATPLPTAVPTATPLPPTISINNFTVTEGNSGTVNATFTVSLSKTSTQTVTVNFATANNTATAPSDFTANSGMLTFTAGQTSRTFTILVNGDTTVESTETFFANLSSATNATISDSQGIGTIANDDNPPPTTTRTIRGRVTTSTGTGIPNVQLTRTGGSNVVTNSNGEYVFTVAPGTYTIAPLITPSLSGVTFNPTSRTLTVGGSNLTNINFTAFFTITGRVSNSQGVVIPNIQIKRQAGTSVVTVATDSNGIFRYTGVRSGSYTISPNITPAMTGMTFNPTSYNVTVNTANLTNINFLVFFSISGRVTNSAGVGLPNVLLTRRQGTSAVTAVTDANGNYRFGDVRSGSYTITASQTGKTFSPASRNVTVGTLNLTNINFIGS